MEALRGLHLDVWFDAELNAGDVFSEKIEAHLKLARCVLVLWTKDAVDKGPRGWVRSEADWALQRDKLIQAQLEPVRLPPPFFSSVAVPIDLASSILAARKPSESAWVALLEAVAPFTKRPGLPHLQTALRSDTLLLAWAARYSDDPLVETRSDTFSPIASRIRGLREADVRRIEQRGSLEVELRTLVEETQRAPIPYFETSNTFVVGDRGGMLPRTASALLTLGLDVNVYGLEFYDLAIERDFEGATPVLRITGEVRNIGRVARLIPPIRVSLRDVNSHEVFGLAKVVTEQILEAGSAFPFAINVENPPAEAVDLEATFSSPLDVAPAGASPSGNELLLDTPLEHGAELLDPS